jgi:Protein of unknown function (DUF3551)
MELRVKYPVFVLGIIAAVVFFASATEAQNYPWCLRTNFGDETVNCGFDSFEQCMASLSGGGASGYCIQNNTYKPPAPEVSTEATPVQAAAAPAKKTQPHSTSQPTTQGTGLNH